MLPQNLDQALLHPNSYFSYFKKLEQKTLGDPFKRLSAPINQDLTLEWMLQNQDVVVRAIIHSIGQEDFEWTAFRETVIRQSAIKSRFIFKSIWCERLLLSVMADFLNQVIAPVLSTQVYSFQKGRGTLDVFHDLGHFLKQQTQDIYVLKRDVSKYGDTINHQIALDQLQILGVGQKGSTLFFHLIGLHLRTPSRSKDSQAFSLWRGIPSGSPLVPPIENLYLGPLDLELGQIPQSYYARYGDDFIFVHPDLTKINMAEEKINTTLASLKLSTKIEKHLNLRLRPKALIQHQSHGFKEASGFEHLGHWIRRQGTLGPKAAKFEFLKKSIKNKIHRDAWLMTKFDLPLEQRIQLFLKRLNHRLGTHFPWHLIAVYQNSNPDILKELDQHKIKWVAGALVKNFGLKPRQAYTLIRQNPLFSYHYLYRQKKRPQTAKKAA